jgi:putative hydrolase of the HAD superfamily
MASGIRAIVFDLDGTLYSNDDFSAEIKWGAGIYIAELKGITVENAATLIRETRQRLSSERGQEATLSAVCVELGGSIAGFHTRVTALLTALAKRFELYIYTNNNRTLTERILQEIGLAGLFARIFTIEDFWRPKPDREVLNHIFATILKNPEECLFVGDRYDVDLKLPTEMGCSSFLVTNIQSLLELETFLSSLPTNPRKA